MKLILSSCDFGNPESTAFIKKHLCKPLADNRVLFFPNEKATREKIESGKYESRLISFGFQKKNISVFNYYDPDTFADLDIDVIYISGGNTFGTLKRIREAGFDKHIIDYVQNGAVYIGGSAGAHIACANIAHVRKYDTDTFGLTDYSGLGLFEGILLCHYTEERAGDLTFLKNNSKYRAIPLKDTDSILIHDN